MCKLMTSSTSLELYNNNLHFEIGRWNDAPDPYEVYKIYAIHTKASIPEKKHHEKN